jgi:hypothetical protein
MLGGQHLVSLTCQAEASVAYRGFPTVDRRPSVRRGRFPTIVATPTESGVDSCAVRRADRGKWGLRAWLRRGTCMFSSWKKGTPTGQHAGFLGSTRIRAFVGCTDATGWRAWCSKAWIRGPVRRFLRQVGPAGICQRTNGSSLPTGCWLGRVFNRSLVILGGPRPQSAGELARNRPDSRRYHPFRAQKMAQKRRLRPRLAKLVGDDELRDYVVECLSKRWSPQQVCRALKERFPGEKHRHLAHETVYRAFYHLSIRPVPAGSARLLRSGKFSRRPRSRTKVKPRQYIADALKIGDRPAPSLPGKNRAIGKVTSSWGRETNQR